jgi:hypothetical protein
MGISGVPFFVIYKGGTKDTDEPITLSGAQVCVVCERGKGCLYEKRAQQIHKHTHSATELSNGYLQLVLH